jgi:HK97 family phage major capsid protein
MGLQNVKQAVGQLKQIMTRMEIENRTVLTAAEIKSADEFLSVIDREKLHGESAEVFEWLGTVSRNEALRADPESNRMIDCSSGPEVPGYRLKLPHEKKDFRSLYGSVPQNDHQWQDRDAGFFAAVFSGRFHPGLSKRAMVENGAPSDGGFLVPVQYAEKIHNVSLESELVLPRATVQPMTSNELKLSAMEIGDHSANLFGGFTASYKGEEATLDEATPKTREMTLRARKLTGFLKFSNELVADATSGEKKIVNICGKGLAWYRDKSFLKGLGSGTPQGILNASCRIEVEKAGGQASATILYENLANMMARMYAGSFQNSIWICHQSTIPQLLQLTVEVGTGGNHIPVLKESNGSFSMLTRPVIFTEKTEPLGTAGDIVLADLSQYVVGLREEMRIDFSPHVYFTTDHLAARLIERHDGQPLWDEALTLEDGSTTVSPFITLAERS